MKNPPPRVILWVWKRAAELEEMIDSHPSLVLLLKATIAVCHMFVAIWRLWLSLRQ